MTATYLSETSMSFYWTTQGYIPEDCIFICECEILIRLIFKLMVSWNVMLCSSMADGYNARSIGTSLPNYMMQQLR